jgi:excisionase family DNA binding protein
MNYTFEQLPQAVNKLHERLDGIEKLLRSNQSVELEFSSELLTIQQASTFLNLSVPTLYSKVSKKEIPVNKKGKRLYFSRSELLKWIHSGHQQTAEEIREQADEVLVSIHRKRKQ